MGVLITKYERGAVIFERAVKVDLRAGDKAVEVSGGAEKVMVTLHLEGAS